MIAFWIYTPYENINHGPTNTHNATHRPIIRLRIRLTDIQRPLRTPIQLLALRLELLTFGIRRGPVLLVVVACRGDSGDTAQEEPDDGEVGEGEVHGGVATEAVAILRKERMECDISV